MATIDILARLRNEASADAKKIADGVQAIGAAAKSSDQDIKRLNEIVGTGMKVATGVAVAGLGLMAAGIVASLDAARDAQVVQAQLAAVIESTGGAAGLTAAEVNKLAAEQERLNQIDGDFILTGQNMLMTFTQIGEDVFPRASQTMLDMATAMTQGNVTAEALSGQAIQLGKALNDPINGISALTRVGVTFTDQQKDMIRTMVEMGDVAGAQTVILDELAKEFGGSAAANAATLDGQLRGINITMGMVAETAGNSMLPAVTMVIGEINEAARESLPALTKAFEDLEPVLTRTAENSLPAVTEAVTTAIGSVALMAQSTHWEALRQEFMDSGGNIIEYYEVLDGATQRFDLFRTAADIEQDMATGELAIERLEFALEAMNAGLEIGTAEFYDYIRAQQVAEAQANILHVEIREGETFFQALARAEEEAARAAFDLARHQAALADEMAITNGTLEDMTFTTEDLSEMQTALAFDTIATTNAYQAYGEELGRAREAEVEMGEAAMEASILRKEANEQATAAALELAEAQAELNRISGDYFTTAIEGEGAQDSLSEAMYNAAAASGANAAQLAILRGALDLSSASAIEAAVRYAAVQIEIDRLGQLYAEGKIKIDEYITGVQNFAAGLDGAAQAAGPMAGAIDTGPTRAIRELGNEADIAAGKINNIPKDINIHTSYTQSGEPPPGLGGGAVGGAGAGGGGTGNPGFASGGFTGLGPVNEIAGYVHRQEYVFDAGAVDRIGRSNLQALHQGGTGGGDTYYINIDARGAAPGVESNIMRGVEYVMREHTRASDGQRRMR